MGKTFLLIPGAWMGQWVWDDLKSRLEKRDHHVHTLTLRGLKPDKDAKAVGLQDHVDDVIQYMNERGLADVILVGHSYSGVVVAQVADRIPDNLAQLVFVEAFLPVHGQNLLECAGLDVDEEIRVIENNNGTWPPPTLTELRHQPYLSEVQVNHLHQKLTDHPGRTVRDPVGIRSERLPVPSVFIGEHLGLSDRQKALYGHVSHHTLPGGHWPMLTKPEELAKTLSTL